MLDVTDGITFQGFSIMETNGVRIITDKVLVSLLAVLMGLYFVKKARNKKTT